jgi:hypothetical protein
VEETNAAIEQTEGGPVNSIASWRCSSSRTPPVSLRETASQQGRWRKKDIRIQERSGSRQVYLSNGNAAINRTGAILR